MVNRLLGTYVFHSNMALTLECVEAGASGVLDTSIICRVNGGDSLSKDEIDKAIDHGATEIMVPMAKSERHIDTALEYIDGRVTSIVMIETEEAVALSDKFSNYPIDKVYVGLNDLSICRNSRNIFLPIVDGTLYSV